MKKIIYLLIILSIYGCGIQRKTYCERKKARVARILKDCPNIIDTVSTSDTVYLSDTVTIYMDTQVDSTHIDSLLKAYCDAARVENKGKKDSNNKAEVIREVIYRDREHARDGDYHLKDQKGRPVHLVIDGRKMQIETKDTIIVSVPSIIIPCPGPESESSKALSLWPWLLLIAVVFFITGRWVKFSS